jgi:hypothetical protein
MKRKGKVPFDPKVFLDTESIGRTISKYRKDQTVFSQSSRIFWLGLSELRRTLLINCSIRARSAWQGLFSYWRISARTVGPSG